LLEKKSVFISIQYLFYTEKGNETFEQTNFCSKKFKNKSKLPALFGIFFLDLFINILGTYIAYLILNLKINPYFIKKKLN